MVKTWKHTQAKVLSSADRLERNDQVEARYRDFTYAYMVNGAQYFGIGSIYNGELSAEDEISVRYDPEHPENSMAEAEIMKNQIHEDGSDCPLYVGITTIPVGAVVTLLFMPDIYKLQLFGLNYAVSFVLAVLCNIVQGRKLIARLSGKS